MHKTMRHWILHPVCSTSRLMTFVTSNPAQTPAIVLMAAFFITYLSQKYSGLQDEGTSCKLGDRVQFPTATSVAVV